VSEPAEVGSVVGVEYSGSGTVAVAVLATVIIPEIATMDVYELVASFELVGDAACLLYFAAWCTTPSLLDSIVVPFSRAISSNAMQAKSAQKIVKRKGDLVANGV
jgi:hypothetical protein